MSFISTDTDNFHDKLIKNVKKEVKQIMEEAVTRKFVHEDSSSITSLCAAVEACLSQGLRRRALGLFKTSSTTALLHKVGKSFAPAGSISQLVQDIENSEPNKRSSSSGDSTNRLMKPQLTKKNSASGVLTISNCSSTSLLSPPPMPRYLWLRLALFEKQLAKIIDHLVQNSSKYYEKDALVSDPDCGSILSSLLVGPCALDYSRTKTQDHFWTDPPADELVQRHRISGHNSTNTPPVTRRPALNFRRSLHGVNSSEESMPRPLTSNCAKEYVESLHQNSRATLLYGKNNVLVLPKDLTEPIPGYLSLHQSPNALTIKWTPNQLMNGYNEAPQDPAVKRRLSLPIRGSPPIAPDSIFRRHSFSVVDYLFWDYAMHVNVDDIVYVHCHQQADSGGTVVLVGLDGVQRPPIHFPRGGHLLAFLSCLETGLLPHGQLDPPLWSQRGKGKVFPRLRRKARAVLEKPGIFSSNSSGGSTGGSSTEEEEAADYVFRIISKANHEELSEWFFPRSPAPASPGTRSSLFSTSTTSSTSSSKSLSLDGGPPEPSPPPIPKAFKISPGDSLQLLCDTMKRQIISRAFYGWLAYCRHLTTVRTHLSGLVHPTIIVVQEPVDASAGLTEAKWLAMTSDGRLPDEAEVFRLTYFGGVAHSIRKQVWPYLLGHVPFASTEEERKEQDRSVQRAYETTMSEWLAVEAIVRQKDKETMAANLAKLSSESTSNAGDAPPQVNQELPNDVFDSDSSDSDPEEAQNEGAPRQGRRPTVCPPNSLETPDAADNARQQAPEPGKIVQGINRAQPQPQASVERSSSPDEGVGEELDEAAPPEPEHKETKHVETEPVLVTTTNPSVDSGNQSEAVEDNTAPVNGNAQGLTLEQINGGVSPGSRSGAVSPASSQGGVYSTELLENYGLNLHRIEKDVQRCDRNYWYFATEGNLDKLRNVMCTYVWEHLDIGYMQGMCDLVAPLLVILDDEALAYACFCRLMDRMVSNFPNGGAMDTHFANMRSLIQILDSEMFELMHQHGDYTHFYFCYRWFLLDFKRELLYDDVFVTWETIWASKHVASQQFGLFLALALVETYRDIILSNAMDFTDIIKFFNEMAERHDAKAVLNLARSLVLQLQTLIENK